MEVKTIPTLKCAAAPRYLSTENSKEQQHSSDVFRKYEETPVLVSCVNGVIAPVFNVLGKVKGYRIYSRQKGYVYAKVLGFNNVFALIYCRSAKDMRRRNYKVRYYNILDVCSIKTQHTIEEALDMYNVKIIGEGGIFNALY